MKRNIIAVLMSALLSLCLPLNAVAEEEGTHGADFSSEDWDGDIDLGFNFEDGEDTTGVKETVSLPKSGIRVGVENGEIVVCAAQSCLLPILRIDGTTVCILKVTPGKTTVEIPGTGLFIVAGKKIAL